MSYLLLVPLFQFLHSRCIGSQVLPDSSILLRFSLLIRCLILEKPHSIRTSQDQQRSYSYLAG